MKFKKLKFVKSQSQLYFCTMKGHHVGMVMMITWVCRRHGLTQGDAQTHAPGG